MIKVIRFLCVGFIFFALATEVILSQDSLKLGYDHPHYAAVWPFDLKFEKDFSTPDSIISSESGEIKIGFEHDMSGNICNIYIYKIILKDKDGNIVYDYQSSRIMGGILKEDDKDEMFNRLSNLIHNYIYNEMKLIRNENPFFRDRYHANYTIIF